MIFDPFFNSEMSLKDKQSFFYPTEVLSVMMGTGFPDGNISKFKKCTLIVWNVLLMSIALIYFVCYILMVKQALAETKQFFRYIGMLLSLFEALAKYTVLRLNQQKIQGVKETLLDKQYNYESWGPFHPGKMFNDSRTSCRRIVITILSVYCVFVVSASTLVIVELNRTYIKSKSIYFPDNVTCYDFMPYSFVIPFPTTTILSCQCAAIFMGLGCGILGSFVASYDTTFTSILICIKIKIQILNDAIKSIRERALSKVNLHEESDLELVDPKLEEMLFEEIIHCAKHLDSLLSVCAETDNIFKYVTLMQMLDSLLVMASCLFVASQSDSDLFTMAQYILGVVTQLLTICYFGNEVTEVSSILNSSIYQSNWLNCSKRYKQCLIIMMCRMQKKIYMTIGKFSPLTLDTFLVVVKGSFSYCAVFQQVNNE